ncbi:MAG: threonylcarbamoyl-AMP synthase [Thermoplasmata archaeon]|nr:MAG: threonylcarbamoyl-AMP synthase [Thermoplasmata archaeon]
MQSEVEQAKRLLREGKAVVYPTDTLYGLGVNALDEEAVRHVYEIKKRPHSLPLPIAVSGIDVMDSYAHMNEPARIIAHHFLPGAVTLVLKKKPSIPDAVTRETVAIRIPDNPVALQLAQEFPITATSANLHGGEEPRSIEMARRQLGNKVALYIEGGTLHGVPSTVIDVSEGRVKILRKGMVKEDDIYRCVREL